MCAVEEIEKSTFLGGKGVKRAQKSKLLSIVELSED